MTYLPIVERELRSAGRNWKTYWGRTFAAASTLLVCGFVMLATRELRPGESGRVIFVVLTSLLAFGCLFAGPSATADSLSSEKREGTLGFLFLTDLRVLDIIAGKLAAGSLKVIYSVAASLPIVGLPMLMGGISFGEFIRVAVTLGIILFMSVSVGILSSSIFKKAQNSVGWCVIFLAVLAGALPMFVALWCGNRNQSPNVWWMSASPGVAMFSAFNEGYRSEPALFFVSNTILVVVGCVSLALAGWLLPHRWQDRPGTVKRQRLREWWRNFQFGQPAFRAALRRQLLDREAFLWLASRVRFKRIGVWITLGLMVLLWFIAALRNHGDWLCPESYLASAIGLTYLFRLAVASEVIQPIAETRSQGALELLLATPLTADDIVRGQWLALKRIYFRPFLVMLCLLLLLFYAGLTSPEMRSGHGAWVLLWLGGFAAFLVDLAALFYVGLWSGVSSPTLQQAFGQVMIQILLLPWLMFGLLCSATSIAVTLLLRVSFHPPDWSLTLLWCAISLGFNASFALRARHRFAHELRIVAMKRFEKRLPPWQKWLGATPSGQSDGTSAS